MLYGAASSSSSPRQITPRSPPAKLIAHSRHRVLFFLPQRRHEGARRAGQRAVILDVECHLTGVAFAVQRELFPVHGVGALSGLAHESDGGGSAGLDVQCDGTLGIRVRARHARAAAIASSDTV